MNEDPTLKNMPHEKEFDNDNYELIEEKETAVVKIPHPRFINFLHINILHGETYCTSNYKGSFKAWFMTYLVIAIRLYF